MPLSVPSPLSLCSISLNNVVCANFSLTKCRLIRMADAQHEEVLLSCNPLLSKKPINTKSSFALRHPMAEQIKLPFSFVPAVFSLCRINKHYCGFGVSVLSGIACSHPSPSSAAVAAALLFRPSNLCFFPIKKSRAAPWLCVCVHVHHVGECPSRKPVLFSRADKAALR